jgi:hypothetical protein
LLFLSGQPNAAFRLLINFGTISFIFSGGSCLNVNVVGSVGEHLRMTGQGSSGVAARIPLRCTLRIDAVNPNQTIAESPCCFGQ